MKSSEKKNKTNDIVFDDIFFFENEEDQIEIDAKVLMAKFLSEVQSIADDKNLKRKELASLIGTSASYLTQLFRGHKLMNFITAAKLQRALDVEFDISLMSDSKFNNDLEDDIDPEFIQKWFASKKESGKYLMIMKNESKPINNENDYDFTVPESYKQFA